MKKSIKKHFSINALSIPKSHFLLGLKEAVILSYLVNTFCQSAESVLKENDGWFSITQKEIGEELYLGDYQVREALNNLFVDGIIERKRMGIPPRYYYKIDLKELESIVNREGI